MEANEFVVVLVTTGGAEESDRIASALVEERLAACVNIVGPIQSVYRWQGKLERTAEHVLVIKARRSHFAALTVRVQELHSYDTPEVIAVRLEAGAPHYLNWLAESTALP
jgi:periplasmic divalent cation tolerance protein